MSLSVHKFHNLTRQEAVPAQIEYDKNTVRYGKNDNFPLRLARLVQSSPTATSCIDTKCNFITGNGFSESGLTDLIVNSKKERFGDIHAINSEAFSLFEGFAIRVLYNAKGNISEIFSIPFEYCRMGKPDSNGVVNKIYVNPYFGTGEYNKRYTDTYDVYDPNPRTVLAQQSKDGSAYLGQILYVGTTGPLSRFYPAPKYYACANWMGVDEASGGFHKNNIENNFFQSIIINLIGDESEPSKHPDDVIWDEAANAFVTDPKKTQGWRFNIEMQKFSGWEKAGNIMALWGRSKEEIPTITPFPSNTNADLFKTLQDLATEQIARATKVPAVLANIQSGASLGGDGNNIRASVKLMQQGTSKDRALLERIYKELLSHFEKPYTGDVKILNYNPFPEMEKIDPLVWETLRLDEKRDYVKSKTDFKLKPELVQPNETKVDEDTLKAQAALRGSVGGVQGVLQIQQGVVAKTTTAESAISILTIIYGFTDSEARQLLGQPKQSLLTNKFADIFYADYPASAQMRAKKALDFKTKMNSNCGTRGGWMMCEDIIAKKPLSFKAIKRIYNYLNKNREFENAVFSDSCESLLFSAWGGSYMLDWASNKISSINE